MKTTTLSTDALLSVMTVPLLMGLLGMRAMTDVMQGVGLVSEEIFRGDRLPVLKRVPSSDSPDTGS